MVIAIIGESCVGKSTIAEKLKDRLNAEVYSGKDYLRFAKNEEEAIKLFREKLADESQNIIYVISEKEHLAFLPQSAVKVLVTADISVIKERFAKRTGGKLPPPVADMLERKHGMFDGIPADIHVVSGEDAIEDVCDRISDICK